MVDEFRPVFVMGCPRSGTTLLTVILDRHSAFAATPETHFFPLSYRRNPSCTDPEELVRLFCENPGSADCGFDASVLRDALAVGPANHASLLRAALTSYSKGLGKRFVVEKTPGHLPFTPLILGWYPQARCVCIVRDGRDVALSLKQVEWTHENVYVHSLRWRYSAALAMKFAEQYAERFHIIRYENLLKDPYDTVSELMDFLGASFETQQLAASGTSHVIPERERPWKEKATRELDRGNLAVWRKVASNREFHIMDAVMGDYLRDYGYDDSQTPCWSPFRACAIGADLLMQLHSPRYFWNWRIQRRLRQIEKRYGGRSVSPEGT